jgi:hypothetical protein
MPRLITGFVAALTLQVVALVLAHDLVFLVRYGSRYGEALVHSGHGETWSSAVGTILVIASALVLAGAFRLVRLGILLRAMRSNAGPNASARAGALDLRQLLRLWLRVAPRIALVSVVLLTVQENLERASIGGSMPGPGILLSPEYPFALWIAIAVGLLVGLLAALFEWRRRALMERLRAARAALPRHSSAAQPRPRSAPRGPGVSVLGRQSGLRAPPATSGA